MFGVVKGGRGITKEVNMFQITLQCLASACGVILMSLSPFDRTSQHRPNSSFCPDN